MNKLTISLITVAAATVGVAIASKMGLITIPESITKHVPDAINDLIKKSDSIADVAVDTVGKVAETVADSVAEAAAV